MPAKADDNSTETPKQEELKLDEPVKTEKKSKPAAKTGRTINTVTCIIRSPYS